MTFEKNTQPQWRRNKAREIVQLIVDETKVELTCSDYLIDEIAKRLGIYPQGEENDECKG